MSPSIQTQNSENEDPRCDTRGGQEQATLFGQNQPNQPRAAPLLPLYWPLLGPASHQHPVFVPRLPFHWLLLGPTSGQPTFLGPSCGLHPPFWPLFAAGFNPTTHAWLSFPGAFGHCVEPLFSPTSADLHLLQLLK